MRGERVLGTRRSLVVDEEVPSVKETLHPQEALVILDPTPPPVSPEVVSEARLGAADLIKLGRLTAPKVTLTAFVDHDLYQRIQTHHEGGITKFIQDAISNPNAPTDVVEILLAEKMLADRRSGVSTTTIGARVPVPQGKRVTDLADTARKKGVPGVSKNAIVSGLVMLYALQEGILNGE